MNKQELIDKYEAAECVVDFVSGKTLLKNIRRDLEQLDEPQPVKVPQFVADWIEKCKTFEHFVVSLSFALRPIAWEENNLSDKCINWLMDANNQETVARAWLDDYEVEKEKRYRISMPKARNYMNHAQFLCEKDGKIFWCGEWYPFKTKFTRKQLEDAGFGWVFDCEGVEVEEVEG